MLLPLHCMACSVRAHCLGCASASGHLDILVVATTCNFADTLFSILPASGLLAIVANGITDTRSGPTLSAHTLSILFPGVHDGTLTKNCWQDGS